MTDLDRRSFLKCGVAATAAASALPAWFARAALAGQPGDRVLVLVQLEGGNDGLNTVIPFADDLYHRARPGLGIPANQVVRLDDHVGLHPGLGALRGCFDQGRLAVLQGVGYPNPNRSHFESTDIWHTASPDGLGRRTGWLGRALDRLPLEGDVPAIHLDPGPLSLAFVGEKVVVPSIADAERFRVGGGARALVAALAERRRVGETLEYVRRSAHQSYVTAGRVDDALRGGAGRDAYPGSDLARRLWQVARMIEADLPARVYAVRLAGFDTHSRQKQAHAELMQRLGDALAAFDRDLKARGLHERVLLVTYSEFGRRVHENRSLGTDHGAAAPMLALGGALNGGVHGAHPSLQDLEDGDLQFHTDFRQVYATLLDRWLRTDPNAVLGKDYQRLKFV